VTKQAFELYQYIAPAILAPLSFWLWWRTYDGNLELTLLAWLVPIAYAYVVPGIGTNVLKVWEFDTRIRVGRFRPHHGFVFGSATAMLAWICHGHFARSMGDVLIDSLVLASVLGFWNLIYDVHAIQTGILRVYNQPWADGKGPEAVTMDYAPWFFAGFGAVYGAGLGVSELLAQRGALTGPVFAAWFLTFLGAGILLPVLGYRRRSFRLHGHSGCRPVMRGQGGRS
jgi:hypothetical protein